MATSRLAVSDLQMLMIFIFVKQEILFFHFLGKIGGHLVLGFICYCSMYSHCCSVGEKSTVFASWSMQSGCKEDNLGDPICWQLSVIGSSA